LLATQLLGAYGAQKYTSVALLFDPLLSPFIPVHTSQPLSFLSIVILSSELLLSLPSGVFSRIYCTKILYIFLVSFIRATCTAQFMHLDLIVIFYEEQNVEAPKVKVSVHLTLQYFTSFFLRKLIQDLY